MRQRSGLSDREHSGGRLPPSIRRAAGGGEVVAEGEQACPVCLDAGEDAPCVEADT